MHIPGDVYARCACEKGVHARGGKGGVPEEARDERSEAVAQHLPPAAVSRGVVSLFQLRFALFAVCGVGANSLSARVRMGRGGRTFRRAAADQVEANEGDTEDAGAACHGEEANEEGGECAAGREGLLAQAVRAEEEGGGEREEHVHRLVEE